jgi:GntR family transcriptional regulator/MocR family aminotransferase
MASSNGFAEFLDRGELDRHLRRMRTRYRRRRDALVAAFADQLPSATVEGIAAGLHAAVRLTDADDETAILENAIRRRIVLSVISQFEMEPVWGPPTLLIGYGQTPEATVHAGVAEIAEVIRASRRRACRTD